MWHTLNLFTDSLSQKGCLSYLFVSSQTLITGNAENPVQCAHNTEINPKQTDGNRAAVGLASRSI